MGAGKYGIFKIDRAFHKGNPEVERVFEMFRAFNKDLLYKSIIMS
jgi:hypothetical protein